MNALKRAYDYVELPTKLASVLPFFTAIAYCFFLLSGTGYALHVSSTLLFFAAMLLFDMTTTMINNYIDRRQSGKQGYFSRPVMLAMIFCALLPAAAIGVYLAWHYGIVFLLAGIFCFFIGITYTFGPMPISRSSYGELFSGLTLGLVLPFLVVTINTPALVQLTLTGWTASLTLDFLGLIKLVLVCAPLVLCISNIMLANNICDYEADKATRYTLPRHIGIENGIRLFTALYVFCYLAIVAAVAAGAIPWLSLFVLLTALPVSRNVRRFNEKQVKSQTFALSVKNFLTIITPYAISIFAGTIL
ncbi:MAG: UbiA family prenyltransferase [Spirochaetes bacterium]|nr:UbiA family prenyltransferase [Spirochaetota bacterium]